jgi:hypothetical protein
MHQLASFDVLQHELKVWSHTVSSTNGCMDLFNGVSAAPTLGLLEDACPTSVLLEEMHRLGRVPTRARIAHERVPVTNFDCRDAHSKKFYFPGVVVS